MLNMLLYCCVRDLLFNFYLPFGNVCFNICYVCEVADVNDTNRTTKIDRFHEVLTYIFFETSRKLQRAQVTLMFVPQTCFHKIF